MGVPGRLFDRFLGLPEAVVDDVAVTPDLRVPMPDGVALLADRYRPRGAGPLPGCGHGVPGSRSFMVSKIPPH
jgi:predicted acyl esterase